MICYVCGCDDDFDNFKCSRCNTPYNPSRMILTQKSFFLKAQQHRSDVINNRLKKDTFPEPQKYYFEISVGRYIRDRIIVNKQAVIVNNKYYPIENIKSMIFNNYSTSYIVRGFNSGPIMQTETYKIGFIDNFDKKITLNCNADEYMKLFDAFWTVFGHKLAWNLLMRLKSGETFEWKKGFLYKLGICDHGIYVINHSENKENLLYVIFKWCDYKKTWDMSIRDNEWCFYSYCDNAGECGLYYSSNHEIALESIQEYSMFTLFFRLAIKNKYPLLSTIINKNLI